jgi:hypothetical protein
MDCVTRLSPESKMQRRWPPAPPCKVPYFELTVGDLASDDETYLTLRSNLRNLMFAVLPTDVFEICVWAAVPSPPSVQKPTT